MGNFTDKQKELLLKAGSYVLWPSTRKAPISVDQYHGRGRAIVELFSHDCITIKLGNTRYELIADKTGFQSDIRIARYFNW